MNNIKYLFLILFLAGCNRDYNPGYNKYTVIQDGQTYTNLDLILLGSGYSHCVNKNNKHVYFYGTHSITKE